MAGGGADGALAGDVFVDDACNDDAFADDAFTNDAHIDDVHIDDVFMAGVFAEDHGPEFDPSGAPGEPGGVAMGAIDGVEEAVVVEVDAYGPVVGGGRVDALARQPRANGARRGPALRAVVDRSGGGVDGLQALARHVVPTVLAGDRRFTVGDELAQAFPDGIERGSTIGCRGPGATSFGFALAAGPVASGSWMAVIGGEHLNLAAIEQVGVALHRVVVIAEPPPGSWGAVTSALVDAFDVVVTASPSRISLRDVRRIGAKLRERGGIVIDVGGQWPEAHDIDVTVTGQSWAGLGRGHGVLTARQVQVAVSGRRGVRPRTCNLWLPGPGALPLMDLEDVGVEDVGVEDVGVEGVGVEAPDDDAAFAGSDVAELLESDDSRPLRRVG